MDRRTGGRNLREKAAVKKAPLNIDTILGSLLGTGFLPFMPGTFGTLFTFGIWLLLPAVAFDPASRLIYGIALALFTLLSVLISSRAEKHLGHDAPQIVIDEMCGFLVSVLFLPHTLMIGIYGVVLFRVFDIVKPFPVSTAQKLPRGWGVVADDLMAGIYAQVLIRVLLHFFPKFFGL